jgi:hypothetical protein
MTKMAKQEPNALSFYGSKMILDSQNNWCQSFWTLDIYHIILFILFFTKIDSHFATSSFITFENQSYEIKSPPWTIWRFRILGIFSIENIDRLGAMMFQNSNFRQ